MTGTRRFEFFFSLAHLGEKRSEMSSGVGHVVARLALAFFSLALPLAGGDRSVPIGRAHFPRATRLVTPPTPLASWRPRSPLSRAPQRSPPRASPPPRVPAPSPPRARVARAREIRFARSRTATPRLLRAAAAPPRLPRTATATATAAPPAAPARRRASSRRCGSWR